jgi:protein involved in polysaccharide export with SLBB domain
MVSLPSYPIEPPDVLQIEMLKQVPLPPYRVRVFDVMQVDVAVGSNPLSLPQYQLRTPDDLFLVAMDGTISLGPTYGTLHVVGMTVEELTAAVKERVGELVREEMIVGVSTQLARAAGTQPVTGEYLVGLDGTVNLRQYGTVHVAGKSIAEAKTALEKHLSQYFDSPEASISVVSYNSKNYYIVTEGAGLGDNIVRVPFTGNETVLDAISNIGGISQLSSKTIWVARPAPEGFGCEQILPVDWDAIAQGGSTSTNYQIMPDDRVFIAEDDTIALTNFINKVIAPLEKVMGTTSLGTRTLRGFQTTGRDFNRNRR